MRGTGGRRGWAALPRERNQGLWVPQRGTHRGAQTRRLAMLLALLTSPPTSNRCVASTTTRVTRGGWTMSLRASTTGRYAISRHLRSSLTFFHFLSFSISYSCVSPSRLCSRPRRKAIGCAMTEAAGVFECTTGTPSSCRWTDRDDRRAVCGRQNQKERHQRLSESPPRHASGTAVCEPERRDAARRAGPRPVHGALLLRVLGTSSRVRFSFIFSDL